MNAVTPTTVPAKQAITLPCEGKLVEIIHARATRDELPLGRAAMALLEEGLRALNSPASGDAPTIEPSETVLANIPDNALAAEVARRLTQGVGTDDYDAAIERAEAAEATLAALKGLLA